MHCSMRRISCSMTARSSAGRPGGGVALQAGLHQHLDRGQRVAQLVGDAGGHLADGRQLLGPQHLVLALLQLIDDPADLLDHALHLPVQVGQVAVLLQGDRAQSRLSRPAASRMRTLS